MAMAAFAMFRNSTTRLNRVLTAATSPRYLFWDNISMLSASVGNGAIFVLEPSFRCRQFSSNELPTHNVVQMPALSPTMEKGNIASWKKKEGDKIEAGDVLCEIETDKATLDFESLEDGFLGKILVPAGSNNVAVGQPLAILVDKHEDVARLITLNAEQLSQGPKPHGQKLNDTSAEHAPHDKETKDLQGFRFGPAVRRLLEEFNVDLTALRSTGPRGTLLKADVLTAIRSGKVAKFSATVGTSKVSEVIIRDKNLKSMPSSMPLSSLEAYDDVANTQIRKVIAKRLMESKHGIPHIYLSSKVIIDPLLDLRKDTKEKHGLKVSVNDIVIKVVALALKAVPEANAYWSNENEQVVPCSSVDISIAVATEKGLMTPILRNADQKTLSAISAEVKELADKARHGKLIPSEFQGGTFSISNLGMFPVDQFCAIINPPQAGILAVGRGNKSVCWKEDISGEGKLFSVTEMTMTLSADHRVFNYDVGVRFLDTLNANFKEIKRLLL